MLKNGSFPLALTVTLTVAPCLLGPAAVLSQDSKRPDPIVEAIRDSNPQTARELAHAARILLDARRDADCKAYLKQLAELGADDAGLADLHREFGPAFFLSLARREELAPEGPALAEQVLAAARRVAEDPARLDALITDLADPERRARAFAGLREARRPAIGRLIGVLADEGRADLHVPAADALAAFRSDALEGLLAALEADNPRLLARIAAILAAGSESSAAPALERLIHPTDLDQPTRGAIAGSLRRAGIEPRPREAVERSAAAAFLGAFRVKADALPPDGTAEPRWVWDAEGGTVVERPLTEAARAQWACVRLAHDLARIRPEDASAAVRELAARLEWEQSLAGIDARLPADRGTVARLPTLGADRLLEVLDFSLDMGRSAAAVAATRALGDSATDAQLAARGERESPLVRALNDMNQDVRFAAAEAIMRIHPLRPFAGSARYCETLAFFLGSTDARRVLIGNPKLDEGQSWAGRLGEMGFTADLAATGNALLDQLRTRPDYEFILIVDALGQPDPAELIPWIRSVPGFARMRCVVATQAGNQRRTEVRLSEEWGVAVVPRPHSAEAMRFVIRAVERLPGQRPSPPETRAARAVAVLDWLAAASDSPDAAFYDLLRLEDSVIPLLSDPRFAPRAARVLGGFATPESQRKLVDTASLVAFPIEARNAAVEAFVAAVGKRGVLLTRGQILQQYDRYNAAETLDGETQRVLGAILDAIEGPSRAARP